MIYFPQEVLVNYDEKHQLWLVSKWQQKGAREKGYRPKAGQSRDDCLWDTYQGWFGHWAVSKLLKIPVDLWAEYDKSKPDLEPNIEVRTARRHTDRLLLRKEENFWCKWFHCTIDVNQVWKPEVLVKIHGWIEGMDAIKPENSRLYDPTGKGREEAYMVHNGEPIIKVWK